MGREIRRVPPNWEHPKRERWDYSKGRYAEVLQPMFDRSYKEAMDEWITKHFQWETGTHPDQDPDYRYYAEYAGDPPDVAYYRPDWKEEPTWYQVYETVSEGTPVTPPFATKEELVEYLVENGDYWDQHRRRKGNNIMNCDPWTREQAERFVDVEHAFSLVATGGEVMSGVEALPLLKEKAKQE